MPYGFRVAPGNMALLLKEQGMRQSATGHPGRQACIATTLVASVKWLWAMPCLRGGFGCVCRHTAVDRTTRHRATMCLGYYDLRLERTCPRSQLELHLLLHATASPKWQRYRRNLQLSFSLV